MTYESPREPRRIVEKAESPCGSPQNCQTLVFTSESDRGTVVSARSASWREHIVRNAVETFQDLFEKTLRDMYYAEKAILKACQRWRRRRLQGNSLPHSRRTRSRRSNRSCEELIVSQSGSRRYRARPMVGEHPPQMSLPDEDLKPEWRAAYVAYSKERQAEQLDHPSWLAARFAVEESGDAASLF